jgi:DNA polymerase delta subunit 1
VTRESLRQVESLTHDIADLLFPSSCAHKTTAFNTKVAPLRVMTLAVTPMPTTATETASAEKDPVGIIACCLGDVYGDSDSSASIAFVLGRCGFTKQDEAGSADRFACHYYESEKELLGGWLQWVLEQDADCWATFEAQGTLGYLQHRATVLGLPFDCGRVKNAATCLRSVQSYGKQWNARGGMASASLETFKADNLHGRVFLDMLRLATNKYKSDFHTASFGEIVSRLLQRPYQRLSNAAAAVLFRDATAGLQKVMAACVNDAELILSLFYSMSSLPDAIELSRVTGLSMQDILFKAEMVKVHSVLLRVAHRHERGYILPSTHGGGQLAEGPHVIDPREAQTAGFYPQAAGAVVVCDFQSLYPSVMIANNLCYTTLLADKVDVDELGMNCQQAPAAETGSGRPGSYFCGKQVQQGILPMVLERLLMLRAAAKKQLLEPGLSEIERKALQGRERALKLCANATYGFAGAATSPVQSVAVAEAVLLHGAAMCRRAISLAQSAAMAERLGLCNPRVLYAQTDSIFVLLPDTSVEDASQLGRKLAAAITEEISTPPVKLNYETTVSNFCLQAVNRYAAKTAGGLLLAKGVETDRRDVPGILRRITSEALTALLVKVCERECVSACVRA